MSELPTTQQRNSAYLRNPNRVNWPAPREGAAPADPSPEAPSMAPDQPFGLVQRVGLLEDRLERLEADQARWTSFLRWLSEQLGFRP